MTTSEAAFKLGDTEIRALVYQSGTAGLTMLNVHDDEDTAVQAGLANIREYGGRVIELAHTGQRLITFNLKGRQYSFDPNRIFSDAGIADTLKLQSTWSAEAHAEIRAFAAVFWDAFNLEHEPVIIALHNTMEGPFSVESFLPNACLGSNAAAIHLSPKRSEFDFFYVTERRHYDYFKSHDFNVVLQDNKRVTDDGSLSVFCAKKGTSYINVEAEVGHLGSQVEMLKVVREIRPSAKTERQAPAFAGKLRPGRPNTR